MTLAVKVALNPNTTDFWKALDNALHLSVRRSICLSYTTLSDQ